MAQPEVFIGQREDLTAGLYSQEHPVVLRTGHLRRERHQAHDEQWKDGL